VSVNVIANSAGCLRAFSDFGPIHMKPRNKLSAEKVHKMSTLKMDLRRAHVDAGFIHPRRKRAFGEIDDADSEPAKGSVPDTDSSDFDEPTRRLVRDPETAEGDDDGNNRDPTIRVPPTAININHGIKTTTSVTPHPSPVTL
jgi:hypothetical protein